jgi:hypothetical protein
MRFLVDENVRREVGSWLRTLGHDVAAAPSGLPDPQVLKLARTQRRILITHDAEFANILRYPPTTHRGIIRLKFHPPSIGLILHSLAGLLKQVPATEFPRTLFILEKDGFRRRS